MKTTDPKIRVLIADDHKIVRAGLASLLGTENDIDVVGQAANGREAVEQTLRLMPDVVLMDLMMPVMDGYAAARAIRASGQTRAGTVPIIAMSANAYAEDVKKCLDSGMNAHISKPLFRDVLLRTIARFV